MRKSVEEIIDTIKALKGLTKDYEVADSLGIGSGALSNAKQRDSISFLENLISFCDRENLTLDIIRQTQFPALQSLSTAVKSVAGSCAWNRKYVELSVMSDRPANEDAETVLVPRDLYEDGCIVLQVQGDSMEKLLAHGTKVIVDTRVKDITSGGIYAFRSPLEGSILRECHSEPGGLSLRPYNKNYPSTFISWEEFDKNTIIGRVSFSVVNVFR